MKVAQFMSRPVGRILRVVAGIALATTGLLLGGWGIVLIVVGALLAISGAANLCFIAPLLRVPFRGSTLPK